MMTPSRLTAMLLVTGLTTTLALAEDVEPAKAPVAEGARASAAIVELFGAQLKNAAAEAVSVDQLAGKTIGIYFSAHWCPPCRKFTPKLVAFYNTLKKAGEPFEVVFVSSDRDKKAMYNYMTEKKMPWPALPYNDPRKQPLAKKYSVRGIPKLVILNADGKLISLNGRGEVSGGSPVEVLKKWNAAN